MSGTSIITQAGDEGMRLDKWLARRYPAVSRERWQKQIKNAMVTVNGKRISPSCILRSGDRVDMIPPEEEAIKIPEPENIPVKLLYEDEWFAVVEKEAGTVVYPAFGHDSGTLVNALLTRFSEKLSNLGGPERPGIVHRLDKDTSGLLIVTLDNLAHERIARAFREHRIERYYDAVVKGVPDTENGIIDLPIARAGAGRMRMEVRADGKPSQTRFEIIATDGQHSHLKCQLITGRTHQIRVHLAYLGHPIVGDKLYGTRTRQGANTFQLLHASRVVLDHPITGARLDISCPLPDRFSSYLQMIGTNCIRKAGG